MDHEDSRSTVSSSSRTSSQYSMTDMIDRINLSRVGEGRMRRSQEEEQGTVCLVEQDSGRIKWIQPSGEHAPCVRPWGIDAADPAPDLLVVTDLPDLLVVTHGAHVSSKTTSAVTATMKTPHESLRLLWIVRLGECHGGSCSRCKRAIDQVMPGCTFSSMLNMICANVQVPGSLERALRMLSRGLCQQRQHPPGRACSS